MKQPTDYDFIVYGATSFVGQILTRYLFERHGADPSVRWALAGRSQEKLELLRTLLGPKALELPLLVCDAGDADGLRGLCARTRAIVSTVGPYALYGEPLVKACAETGTDYCDLTGEVQWIHQMISRYEPAARASGARIVHCCGFDSLPSDLGVLFLQTQAQQQFGQYCSSIRMGVRRLKGTASGGTVASMMTFIEQAAKDPALRKLVGNPYVLCPEGENSGVRQPNVQFATFDAAIGSWLAPFVMAAVNTRVVHRSHALAGRPYGKDFLYDEAMMTGPGGKGRTRATLTSLGLGAFVLGATVPVTRQLLERFVLPKPGEGPSPDAQEKGSFDVRLFGRTRDGQTLQTKVTGDRDPGYGSTGKMLGEAIVSLAFDIPADQPGGFWTPATLLGNKLIQRLTEHAGLSFEVVR
jgi:short subunit dehydrogenase-like uncharacterized protein